MLRGVRRRARPPPLLPSRSAAPAGEGAAPRALCPAEGGGGGKRWAPLRGGRSAGLAWLRAAGRLLRPRREVSLPVPARRGQYGRGGPRDEALRPATPRSRRPGSGRAGAAAAGAARPAARLNAALRGRPAAGPGRGSLRSWFQPRAHRPRSRHLSRGMECGGVSAQLLAPRPRQRQSGRRALMNIYSERLRAPPSPPRLPIAPVWAVRAEPTPARLKVERPVGADAACPARPFRCGQVVLFAGCLL
ncbi:uncharacterized protein [Excalfactoria chinensis]|uniref:uncharacterized protein n=1 Tax=Excalfactoria chinensis TaxID=46218 RepID=UPI003B3B6331